MSTVEPLTAEEFKKALPSKVHKSVNQQLIDQVNQTLSDPELYETYRDNLLSYGKVMADGKFKITSYLDAVRYVSFKLMGLTNIESYRRTFPDKIKRFQAQNVEAKQIAAYVTAYHKSKLVSMLMEQTLVPSYVLNQDLYQKALNVQADLMISAKSEKVRSDAANSILTQLKPPETQKVELEVGVKEDSSIAQLRQATLDLVAEQRKMLQAGAVNAKEIAEKSILVDVEGETLED